MVLEHVLPATVAMILDFTRPQRVRNCPRKDGILKNLPGTAAIFLDFTKLQRVHIIVQEWMVFKNMLTSTAAIILDFAKPQRVHKCPRADGIEICFDL